jgi:hypothetical protein
MRTAIFATGRINPSLTKENPHWMNFSLYPRQVKQIGSLLNAGGHGRGYGDDRWLADDRGY